MDNGTTVEAFKFLNYYQLATNSFVSKRYWNLIRYHRRKLALLDVNQIYMHTCFARHDPAVIKTFNKELSIEQYNEWIMRNGYSKQIPVDGQIAGKNSTENDRGIYVFSADIYPNPKRCHGIPTTVFSARAELKDENWPLFQHFFRLLMDPFIYIRKLDLNLQKDIFPSLAGSMNPDHNRLQCERLIIHFNDDTQKFVVWMKNHVRSSGCEIYGNNVSNYDEELIDLFMTGAPCTTSIRVMYHILSKVVVNLVQKFMALKNRDEYHVVESIQGNVKDRGVVEALKRSCAEFIAEEEKLEESRSTGQIIRLINNDIEKKLTLDVRNDNYGSFSITIT